jgi:hypothetical protein
MDNSSKKSLNTAMLVSEKREDESLYDQFNVNELQTFTPKAFVDLSQSKTPCDPIDKIYLTSMGSYGLLVLLNAVHKLLAVDGSLCINSLLLKHGSHTSYLLPRLGFNYILARDDYQHWQKKHTPSWKLSLATGHQQAEISSLFIDVFQHPLAPDLWHWKYKKNRGHAVLAYREDRLVGHYGGMCRDIFISNKPAKALQIGDVMVEKKQRSVFSKRGLFFQMCATFLEQYIGDDKPYALGYGFPTERAMQIAQHQGLYRQVDRMVEKHWKPLNTRSSIFHVIRVLNKTPSAFVWAQISNLWKQMLSDFSHAIIGVRDWDYLYSRYIEHPEKDYHLYRVNHRFTNKAIGIIVLSLEGERCRLMDIISPQQNFVSLIHHARRLAYDLNANQLFAWTTLSHQALWPSDEGQAIDICIPSNAWTTQNSSVSAKHSWWLTAGDTDFC